MSTPIHPLPLADHAAPATSNTGEGAQTALAAMIRKRKMGENHVEPEVVEERAEQPPADA